MPYWLGVPASIVAWSFALYVYVVAPGTKASRFLIAMLITDGIAVVSSYQNPMGHDPPGRRQDQTGNDGS